MEKDKEHIEEIRKLCVENNIGFEETVSTITPSTLKRDKRFENVKQLNKQGKDYFFIEYSKGLVQLKTFVKNYFEKKHIQSDYLAKLVQIVLANKNKVYFIIEKLNDSEVLHGDLVLELFPEVEDRIKLSLNVVSTVIDIRKKMLEKLKDEKLVSLYGISTEKFNYSKENRKVEFINIGIDELIVTDFDLNDKRFWPPEKFTKMFKNLDRYKLDMYALGCVLYEIFSAHPPLEENSTAAYDIIKEKKAPLVSEICKEWLGTELGNYNKKNEIVDLIDKMTQLEESNRTITFEEVYNVLYSFLPNDFSKVKCKNCLEKADVYIREKQEKYCEVCRSLFASKNLAPFYKDNTVPIKEITEDIIPDLMRKVKNNLDELENNNCFKTQIQGINENIEILNQNRTFIDEINKKFDNLIDLLTTKKQNLNEIYLRNFNVSNEYFSKTLSIFTNVEKIVASSITSKQEEIQGIGSHSSQYNKDYDLAFTDLENLEASLKKSKDLEKVTELYSSSYRNKIVNQLSSTNKKFENSLVDGKNIVEQIEESVKQFDRVAEKDHSKKLNPLIEVEGKIDEILKKSGADEKDCLKIAEEEEFNSIIEKTEAIDEETDSVYTKNQN